MNENNFVEDDFIEQNDETMDEQKFIQESGSFENFYDNKRGTSSNKGILITLGIGLVAVVVFLVVIL